MSLDWLPHETDAPHEAALVYAAHGWAVFPCNGKQPITRDGFKGAVSDPEKAISLWACNPAANVGWSLPPEWFALDVDPRHGGDNSLTELQRKHGALPWTLRARTGGGGEHWIFLRPQEEIRQAAGFVPGLDTRLGGRGYLLIAPSIHPDTRRPYRWVTALEPAQAPRWLVDLVVAPKAAPRVEYKPPATWTREQDKRRNYGLAALKGCAEEVRNAASGERNNALNKAWWRMLQLRDAVSVDEIRAELGAAAQACGLPDREISQVLR